MPETSSANVAFKKDTCPHSVILLMGIAYKNTEDVSHWWQCKVCQTRFTLKSCVISPESKLKEASRKLYAAARILKMTANEADDTDEADDLMEVATKMERDALALDPSNSMP